MANSKHPSPSANFSDLSGRIIKGGKNRFGVYRLEKCIGKGTWGVVYRAVVPGIYPLAYYAVKCISYKNMGEKKARRLEREIEIQELCYYTTGGATLRLHDWFRDEKEQNLYVISDFCPEGDLLERILNLDYYGNDELIRSICEQLLDAVESMHDGGVYHRDLKPENILCKDGGKEVLLADFGLSTSREYNSDFGVGSSAYQCPEVQGGVKGDVRVISSEKADIWALGVIFFNIVIVEIPWHKANLNDNVFEEYFYRNRDVLICRSPISEEFNEVLKSVFRIDPVYRASIPEIRAGIRAIKSFYNKSDPRYMRRYARCLKFKAAAEAKRENVKTRSASEISNSEATEGPSIPSFEAVVPVPVAPRRVTSKLPAKSRHWKAKAANPKTNKAADCQPPVDVPTNASEFIIEDATGAPIPSDSSLDSDGPITPEQPAADKATVSDSVEVIQSISNLNLESYGYRKAAVAFPPAVYDDGRAPPSNDQIGDVVRQEVVKPKPKSRFSFVMPMCNPILSDIAHMLRFPENVL